MALNKQAGNMYPFVTHTWNPIKGKCSHDCTYCYMKRFKQNPIRLDEKDLKTQVGEKNMIFVGSGTDMWADDVPDKWILKVLDVCKKEHTNVYLFQSKNPGRFRKEIFRSHLPVHTMFATTLETNRDALCLTVSKAPLPYTRAEHMVMISKAHYLTMITVEPILDFDLSEFVTMIRVCKPSWVNIGADSKGHNLPEPSGDKVWKLIVALQDAGIEVKQKANLKRLFKD